jgi:beta-lactamase superfamily II metal-dependent hydrolase
VKLNKAVISVGANSYHHPLDSYVDALYAIGFVVKQTKLVSDEITITL